MKSKPGTIVLILVLSYKQLYGEVDDGWMENLAVFMGWIPRQQQPGRL